MTTKKYDVGAEIRAFAGGGVAVTAGGGGDATQFAGSWLDRSGYGSAKLVVHYRATLAQGATLSLAADVRDATSNAGAGAAVLGTVLANAVVATGPTGGGTVRGTVELDVSFETARQFVQGRVTPDLSAANTDTAQIEFVWIMGGASRQPSTARGNA